MVIIGVIWGPPWPEFGVCRSTILSIGLLSPKVFNFNYNRGFLKVLGGHKMEKILYIAIYIYSSLVIPSDP